LICKKMNKRRHLGRQSPKHSCIAIDRAAAADGNPLLTETFGLRHFERDSFANPVIGPTIAGYISTAQTATCDRHAGANIGSHQTSQAGSFALTRGAVFGTIRRLFCWPAARRCWPS
jgi:hypothetical protein